MKLKTNKNTSGDFRRNELIQGGTAENPGAYFGAYCLLFRPESPLNSGNGIQFYVTLVPYKSMSPGIFRNKRKAPKTAWEPLQNLYSPVRIWMAPHTKPCRIKVCRVFHFLPFPEFLALMIILMITHCFAIFSCVLFLSEQQKF